jgi:VanZ family protein
MEVNGMDRWLRKQIPESGKRRRFYVFSALALMVALAAWLFSAQPPDTSGAQSTWLKKLMADLLGIEISEFLIRKLAHFGEYLLMGLFAGGAVSQLGFKSRHALSALALTLVAALVDETIQVFSGRGPSVLDVWIDAAGAAIGLVIVKMFKRHSH